LLNEEHPRGDAVQQQAHAQPVAGRLAATVEGGSVAAHRDDVGAQWLGKRVEIIRGKGCGPLCESFIDQQGWNGQGKERGAGTQGVADPSQPERSAREPTAQRHDENQRRKHQRDGDRDTDERNGNDDDDTGRQKRDCSSEARGNQPVGSEQAHASKAPVQAGSRHDASGAVKFDVTPDAAPLCAWRDG
jgi:hypothetical protein